MAGTIRLDKVVEHPDGRFQMEMTINGSSGGGRVYGSKADALIDLQAFDTDDALVRFLLAYWNGRSADLSNTAIMLNKLLTVDFAAPQPIKVN